MTPEVCGNNIFVTGGTGFVGDEIIRRLCTDTDAHLWVMSRASKEAGAAERILSRLDREFHDRITILEGDLGQPVLGLEKNPAQAGLFRQLLNCCDEVIHNGADLSFRTDAESRERVMNSNVGGTTRLLELVRRFRNPLKAFNFTSTAYVHGKWSGDVFPENGRPTEWQNPYEESKWLAESLVVESGPPFRVFRPSVIVKEPEASTISRDGVYMIADSLARGCQLFRKRAGDVDLELEIMSAPHAAQNFVLRRDVVDVIMKLRALPGTMNRQFNTVSPTNTSLVFMWDAIAECLRFRYRLVEAVVTRDPISHMFKRTVVPSYGGYIFHACPRLDQGNVRAALGDDYVDRQLTTIDAEWMKILFRDYFSGIIQGEAAPKRPRRGALTGAETAVTPETGAEEIAPVESETPLKAPGWETVVRVRFLGVEPTIHGGTVHLWRVRQFRKHDEPASSESAG